MKDIVQLTGYMNKFCYIMVIKFKLLQFKKMFNIFKITGDEVVHTNNEIPLFNEPVTKM